jgi:hypothetical protein
MRTKSVFAISLLCATIVRAWAVALPPPIVTVADVEAEKASLQPYERKMDTPLRRLLRDSRGQAALFLESAHASVQEDAIGRVLVNVESHDVTAAVARFQRPDTTLTFADSNLGYAQGWVPVPYLYDLANSDVVTWLQAAYPSRRSVTSQGDSIMHADQARADTGFDGTGVKIGVISTGNLTVPQSIAAGELSATDTHITRGNTNDDEGTAMMQIVHDLAPGSPIYFASGWPTSGVVKASSLTIGSIRSLAAAGCSVVVDDLGERVEPFFEDGAVAQEANFSTWQGITYVTAASNENNDHYLGTYVDGGSVYGARDSTVHLPGAERHSRQAKDIQFYAAVERPVERPGK